MFTGGGVVHINLEGVNSDSTLIKIILESLFVCIFILGVNCSSTQGPYGAKGQIQGSHVQSMHAAP